MPLKLVPPRQGRSPNWTVRGTYLGVSINRSAGTGDKRLARRILRQWAKDIESGELGGRTGATFDVAALAYMKAGGERRYLAPLLNHFGARPLDRIDQNAVDRAAIDLYPNASPATRNRQVYTPIAAVLRHADPGHALRLRRPKQPRGRVRWIEPAQAHRLIAAASPKLRPLIVFLLGTGCRIGEAISLDWEKVSLERSFVWIGETKNGEPRGVHLPDAVLVELANVTARQGRVFGYRDRWLVYDDWLPACAAIGLADFTPHDCRHTWATWMRQYGGLDLRGLLGTGAWRSIHSVLRYQHVAADEASKAADKLPLDAEKRGKSVAEKTRSLK
jgi:integrase